MQAWDNVRLTYRELDQQASQLAQALLERGLTSTDRIVYFGSNSIEYYLLVMAGYYLGVTIVPVASSFAAYEINMRIVEAQATVLVVSRNKLSFLRQLITEYKLTLKLAVVVDHPEPLAADLLAAATTTVDKVCTFGELAANKKQLPRVPYFPVDLEKSLNMIVFTSGTTGTPKAAMYTHRNFLMAVHNYAIYFKAFEGSNVFGMIYPFGHATGVLLIASGILASTTNIIYQDMNDETLIESIGKFKIETMPFTLTMSRKLAQLPAEQCRWPHLRCLMHCSCPFPRPVIAALMDKFKVDVENLYGSTECCGQVAKERNTLEEIDTIGRLLPQMQLKVQDLKTGQSLPAGQFGEICWRGPTVFAGYLNNPEATSEAIDEDGFFRSGDVGYYDSEGRVYLTDRLKELIKFKHFSVAAPEIESFLMSHAAVNDVCVVGVPHATEGYHVRAYVQPKADREASEQELVDFVRNSLGYRKWLTAGVQFVDAIPKLGVGKINRKYFKNLVKNEMIEVPAPPQPEELS